MKRKTLFHATVAAIIGIAVSTTAFGQAPPIRSQAAKPATAAEKKEKARQAREKARQARAERLKARQEKQEKKDKARKARVGKAPVAQTVKAADDEGKQPPIPVPDPPGANNEAPPTTTDAIVKAATTQYKPKGGGHQIKFNLEDADLAELVNHMSGLTGKRFIYGAKVRQIKVTVVSPTPVSLDEAYEAFLSILEANGMTVVPHGRFFKIVDSGGVVTKGTPVYSRATPVPDTDRFVTRLYRLKNVTTEDVVKLLTKFKTKEGDISDFPEGSLLIITDTGANVRRMIRIIEEIDVGTPGSKMWIQPVHYGAAEDIAKQLNEIFELGKGGAGVAGLDRVIGDAQTNSLVIVGTEDSYGKLVELLRRIDMAPTANGRVHVLPLEHAVAEELASTLSQMLTGAAPKKGAKGSSSGAGNAEGMFESEVRVTADKATNSLVVTSTPRDYAQLRLVIAKLDQKRRQVFIEAVIMDVNVNRTSQFGLAYHGGAQENIVGGEPSTVLFGFNPVQSILPDLSQVNALAVGVRGPELDGTQGLPGLPAGVSIPAFGVFINALSTSGDSNVLSTPHVIATDNIEAEIRVGQNIPLQTNFGGGLGNLAGLAAGGAGANNNLGALGGLGLGGLGFGGFNAPRQDVGTRIKLTPHINHNNEVRLEIEEEISEQGATNGTLGAVSIIQRTANTTVVVDDQQTVVIGGLMRDAEREEATKIPVLGDLPVLGVLFRSTNTTSAKTNLLLILTPYVIEDQTDLRKIFERKMQERQEFLDRYFVFTSDWEPPKDFSRTNGLVEEIRQAYLAVEERERLMMERLPDEPPEHEMTEPLELPTEVKPKGTGTSGGTKAKPKPKSRPKRKSAPKRGDSSPIRINPIARSVNVERVE